MIISKGMVKVDHLMRFNSAWRTAFEHCHPKSKGNSTRTLWLEHWTLPKQVSWKVTLTLHSNWITWVGRNCRQPVKLERDSNTRPQVERWLKHCVPKQVEIASHFPWPEVKSRDPVSRSSSWSKSSKWRHESFSVLNLSNWNSNTRPKASKLNNLANWTSMWRKTVCLNLSNCYSTLNRPWWRKQESMCKSFKVNKISQHIFA